MTELSLQKTFDKLMILLRMISNASMKTQGIVLRSKIVSKCGIQNLYHLIV